MSGSDVASGAARDPESCREVKRQSGIAERAERVGQGDRKQERVERPDADEKLSERAHVCCH